MRSVLSLRCCTLLIGASLLLSAPLQAAEIKGVHFADSVRVAETELPLRGTAVLTWALLFDVYAGAFYLPASQPGVEWTAPVPKQLELSYFRNISASDFAESSDTLLRRNLTPQAYRHLAQRLQQLYGLFRDVTPGDRYRLIYRPGTGTELRLNDRRLGTIPGDDFAVAYFGLWLGEQPIDKRFRDRLLGID
ncbi:MAG: chalcone isomerase family protein [Desulfuromonadales bacterium]